MIRPLLSNAVNWTASLLATHKIEPGATIEVKSTGAPTTGAYPHKTEDTYIDLSSISLISAGPIQWFGAKAPPIAQSLDQAFGGQLRTNDSWNSALTGAHILVGTAVASLGAVRIRRSALSFVEEFNKLKGVLSDDIASYKLPITSRVLKEAWRNGGLNAVNRILTAESDLHVRLGLARAFNEQPDKCYVMINGVFW
jgi:hypothetical protein